MSSTGSIQGEELVGQSIGHFKIGRKIGGGSFGSLFIGTNKSNEEEVAIKVERLNDQNQLPLEYAFYKRLRGGMGMPVIFQFGPTSDNLNHGLVMELLGPSLQRQFDQCKNKFTVKTVLQIGLQLIERFEFIHSKGIIYRDTKPENFLLGPPKDPVKSKIVYVIDFGLSKDWKMSDGSHIPFNERKNLTGTARYMSIHMHQKLEQSRRDDCESLGYVLLYFLRGHLPWQGLKISEHRNRYHEIGRVKMETTPAQLCEGFPAGFAQYLEYVRNLDFDATPDYEKMRSIFRKIAETEKITLDEKYDWEK